MVLVVIVVGAEVQAEVELQWTVVLVHAVEDAVSTPYLMESAQLENVNIEHDDVDDVDEVVDD